MPFEKSVLVPLAADETFALITEPEVADAAQAALEAWDDAVQAGPDAGALDRLIAFTGLVT
jgi:hypothetical protein